MFYIQLNFLQMEKHQPIGIDYPIRDDSYIEYSMAQLYMEFNKDCRDESRF